MHFTERLKSLREEHGLNQTQISKILSCTQTAYSKWELGQRDITVESLLLLAKYYNVSLDYITGASNIRSPYPKK
jgi:transcriptional regulator, cro/CI family